MGASGSTISSELKGKVIQKDLLDQDVLAILGNASRLPDQIPVEQVFNALRNKTDVFLTHNWGTNQDNHKRVAEINHALKERGLITWFDSEKMEGNVKKKMTEGIDNASCVVAFITELYIDKVRGDNAEDNCQLEFGYSARSKTAKKMVPVVMESHVRNANAWKGEVGMVLGGLLYVDMCDAITDEKIAELHDRIVSVNDGVKLSAVFEKCLNLAMNHATVPADGGAHASNHGSSHGAVSESHNSHGELYDWLVSTVKLTVKAASAASNILTEANIGTVDRLMRRYQKDNSLLTGLGIDEFDAEDIVKALEAQTRPVSTTEEAEGDAPLLAATGAEEEGEEQQEGEGAAEGEDGEAAVGEGTSSGFSEDMTRVKVSTHDHVLHVIDEDNGWGCDGRHLEGGCRMGCTGFRQTSGWTRYACVRCNYDLCAGCAAEYFTENWSFDTIFTSIHNHALNFTAPESSGWGCDGRKQPGGCKGGCTGFRQTAGWIRYACQPCGFDLCEKCVEAHATEQE